MPADGSAVLAMAWSSDQRTLALAQTGTLKSKPAVGAPKVRRLTARTPLTLLGVEGGWALVAREGRPLGYLPVSDLAPIR